jgi:topoisomerase-4 subunit A
LIDCQGNWGNILTGDGAAASRYIEGVCLSLEVLYSPKLPIGVFCTMVVVQNQTIFRKVSIAFGARSRRNCDFPRKCCLTFNELIDASIKILRKPFTLYPDFMTQGLLMCLITMMDCVAVRAVR